MSDSQRLISYPVPWQSVFSLGPHIMNGTQISVDEFSAGVCSHIYPEPLIEGVEHLPPHGRFVLAANHYQRKGLWIMHSAAVLTQAIRKHYGAIDPPVRWIVTANWPPIKLGPWRFRSPGDMLLPRVAHALACYPVSFAGSNQAYTAQSIRRILRETPKAECPLGLFPEGVGGSAGKLTQPLDGIDRLILHLAKAGVPVQPAGISERGRFVVRFGPSIQKDDLLQADNAARLVMQRIADLI